jgi:hypothetical protein
MPPKESMVITPNDKPLPFPGSAKNYTAGKGGNLIVTNEVTNIPKYLKLISDSRPEVKYVLVEDFTHYQNARMMNDAFVANTGFGKWNIFGKDIFNAIATMDLRDDLFIFFNSHVEQKESGESSFRSSGKLLDNTIDVPSYFTYIVHTDVLRKDNEVQYRFQTAGDGIKQAKMPMGMFKDMFIDNDDMLIVEAIKKYQDA